MSTTHIRYSSLYSDLMKDVEDMYFVSGHSYERRIVEITENHGNKDSVGVIFYDKSDSNAVFMELKKFSSFDESNIIWRMSVSDWNTSALFWTQGWGSVKFKMKVEENSNYTRNHRYSLHKIEKELKLDISVAPDQGLCLWGDTETFLKRAKTILSGLNRSTFLSLSDWNAKDTDSETKSNSVIPACECGAHKVYGKDVNPFFHSRWCRLFVNNR